MLREVEARGTASIAELSEATGLHENTVRGHLDRLCNDGFLRSERALPSGRGRPSLRWHAVRQEVRNPYAGLAIALAATLSETDADAAALMRAAGVAWGTQLAGERESTHEVQEFQGTQDALKTQGAQAAQAAQSASDGIAPTDAHAETIKLVFDVMRDQGFAPEDSWSDGSKQETPTRELLLRSCPILEAAKGNTEVVCAAHRGLVEGLIGSRGDELEVELQPFASPDVCVLRLGSAA